MEAERDSGSLLIVEGGIPKETVDAEAILGVSDRFSVLPAAEVPFIAGEGDRAGLGEGDLALS